MATQKLEDIISFIETQLNTLSQLDTVVYKGEDDQDPPVKNFGAVIYTSKDGFIETEHKHIGPHLTENWTINLDLIIQRKAQTPRTSVSETYGTSYWINTLMTLFFNKTNSGAFVRTYYESEDYEEINSGIKIKGVVRVELLNKYT